MKKAIRVRRVKPRRYYDISTFGKTYKESDADFVANNLSACVWFLENRDRIVKAIGEKS